MLEDGLEDRIKEKLLEGLIEHMHGKMGDDLHKKFGPKEMAVEVAAPNKEGLKMGLEKAKDVAENEDPDMVDGDDEDRLMALMGDKEDDEDKEMES